MKDLRPRSRPKVTRPGGLGAHHVPQPPHLGQRTMCSPCGGGLVYSPNWEPPKALSLHVEGAPAEGGLLPTAGGRRGVGIMWSRLPGKPLGHTQHQSVLQALPFDPGLPLPVLCPGGPQSGGGQRTLQAKWTPHPMSQDEKMGALRDQFPTAAWAIEDEAWPHRSEAPSPLGQRGLSGSLVQTLWTPTPGQCQGRAGRAPRTNPPTPLSQRTLIQEAPLDSTSTSPTPHPNLTPHLQPTRPGEPDAPGG